LKIQDWRPMQLYRHTLSSARTIKVRRALIRFYVGKYDVKNKK
jgi:hypothetical protein